MQLNMDSKKSGTITLLLCIFLGNFGIHRFYVGKILTGLLMLFTFGAFGIWTIVDIVVISCLRFQDGHGNYIGITQQSKNDTLKIIGITLAVVITLILLFVLGFGLQDNHHSNI